MKEKFENQLAWFRSGATRELDNRINSLKRLREALRRHESELLRALRNDLGKTPEESYMTELAPVYAEIACMTRNLARWSRHRERPAWGEGLFGRRVAFREPYGVVLNIAAWMEPLRLSLVPLVDAVAAGNCVMLSPSPRALRTASAVNMVLRESFRTDHVTMTEAGAEPVERLLALPFGKIFFSGTAEDARTVLHGAAETLTPCALELTGKNPVIVMADADIARAARSIVCAKGLAAGQSSWAPDFVLVARAAETDLLTALRAEIVSQFGAHPMDSYDFPRVASPEHFERLTGMIAGENVFCGGGWNRDTLKIEPTVVSRPQPDSPLMREPVFGPVLPVLSYGAIQEAVQLMRQLPAPRALYCFSDDEGAARRLMRDMRFGSGRINDCGTRAASPQVPSGGVGESGMGDCCGRAGFECFTRQKGVYIAPKMERPPCCAPRQGTLNEMHRTFG